MRISPNMYSWVGIVTKSVLRILRSWRFQTTIMKEVKTSAKKMIHRAVCKLGHACEWIEIVRSAWFTSLTGNLSAGLSHGPDNGHSHRRRTRRSVVVDCHIMDLSLSNYHCPASFLVFVSLCRRGRSCPVLSARISSLFEQCTGHQSSHFTLPCASLTCPGARLNPLLFYTATWILVILLLHYLKPVTGNFLQIFAKNKPEVRWFINKFSFYFKQLFCTFHSPRSFVAARNYL